jgi:hypothetical protein
MLSFPLRSGARYRARVERPDGTEIARREGSSITPDPLRAGVTIEVPAVSMPRGDYLIFLEDVSGAIPEAVQEYTVRVLNP